MRIKVIRLLKSLTILLLTWIYKLESKNEVLSVTLLEFLGYSPEIQPVVEEKPKEPKTRMQINARFDALRIFVVTKKSIEEGLENLHKKMIEVNDCDSFEEFKRIVGDRVITTIQTTVEIKIGETLEETLLNIWKSH